MAAGVRYETTGEGRCAAITMDDGRANALSFELFEALGEAFDRAEAAGAGILLAGRDGRFSGGFDLGVLMAGGADTRNLLRAGFELSHRMLSFPRPVVIACTGHAYAMGLFLLLSADYRLGVEGGPHRLTANEVALGLPMPRAAIEVCRQRLTRAHFDRAVLLAEVFDPESAVEAGILDTLVPADDLLAASARKLDALMDLDPAAHAATKLRARAATLEALRGAIEADDEELRSLG